MVSQRRAEESQGPGPPQPEGMAAERPGLEAAGELERDHPPGFPRTAGEVPVFPLVHGHLRPVRGLRGQVPFFHRHGGPQEHAGSAGRAPALGIPEVLYRFRQAPGQAGGGPGPDGRRAQGVVLLFLPVHGVPPLLGLLPLRHRPGGDHHDGEGASQPRGLQHQLGDRAGRKLLPDRKSPGHPAPRDERLAGVLCRRHRGTNRGPGGRTDQPEGGGGSLRDPLGGFLRRPGHLHLHGLPHALPRDRPGLHLVAPTRRREEISASSLPRR